MARLSDTDKLNINLAYLKIGTYSGVAKELGFSPATVKKYVDPNFEVPDVSSKKEVHELPTSFSYLPLIEATNFGDLCILSDEEMKEMENLWKEMVI